VKRSPLSNGAKSLQRGSTFAAERKPLRRVVILGDKANRKPAPKVPAEARHGALERTAGRCITCPDRAVQVHHVLPKSKWPHLAKLADNLVGVCVECHARHESAFRRIPRSALPAVTLALAEREGLTWYIDRTYPWEAAEAC
jgi:hypothetical protein